MKVLETELNERLKIFKNKDVVIIFDDILEAKFYMNNINIYYDYSKGFLHIKEETTQNEINLNIVSAYLIDLTDNVLHIGLDNSLDFEIRLK
ncbi:MAG: hypothetical protein V8R72_00265 [Clostridia bacterium]